MAKKIVKYIRQEFIFWIEGFLRYIPGRIGILLRKNWYRIRLNSAENISIGIGCDFVNPGSIAFKGVTLINNNCYFNASGGSIEAGDWVAFNNGVHLNASCGGSIKIGKKCPIGPGVVMRTANHRFDDVTKFIQDQGHECKDIIIEDDCWISANVIIVGGVTIGRGSVIGAGAVVTKNIPPFSVAAGVPAIVIKSRK
jgi:galactoside O-acetyltransferase